MKQFLIQKIETIFKGIAEGAGRTFNLGTLEIFDEMMEDLRGDMEQKLITGIEEELFSVKTSFGEFEKVYEIMEQQFTGINQAMTGMKQNYEDQMKLLKMASEIVVSDFPKLNDLYQNLNQNFKQILNEIEKTHTNSQETSVNLLQDLKVEIETKTKTLEESETSKQELSSLKEKLTTETEVKTKNIQELEEKNKDLSTQLEEKEKIISELEQSKEELKEKLKGEAQKNLEDKLSKLKFELTEVTQFLEKKSEIPNTILNQ